MRLMTLLIALAVSACASAQHGACADSELAAIEAEHIARVLAACAGYTYEDCPAMPALAARVEAQRKAWVRCR